MVNRTNADIARQTDGRNKQANPPILSSRPSVSRNSSQNEIAVADDVIAYLSNAHENRRARQVFEWERMYSQNWQRAA